MKPYLVDVPVRVNIWIREECQQKQFEVLKAARPSIIFLQSDGGRNEDEWKAIRNNREIFEKEVDWECDIHRVFEEKNNGLYTMDRKINEYIWQRVDRCIFLEDDDIPSVSFFRFCAELLEKYKDDLRVSRICGTNVEEISKDVTADYFFSERGTISGIATWRRVIEKRNFEFEYATDAYVMKLLKERTRKDKIVQKEIEGYPKNYFFNRHIAGPEFFERLEFYSQNQLNIIPRVNLISNIGATADSAHSDELSQLPKGVRNLYNRKTYEMIFPIKQTNYVIPDDRYRKKLERVEGHNKPLVQLNRKMIRLLIKIKNGDFKYIIARVQSKFLKES